MSEYARKQTPKPSLDDLDPTGTLFDPALAETATSEPTPESAEEAAERRLDEQADKLGNYVLARNDLDIDDEKDEDQPPVRARVAKSKSRPSRRGGRSFNEGSDSEHDPHWTGATEPLTEDERVAARAAAAKAREALEISLQKPQPPTEEELLAQRHADAARIREQARASWAEFDDKQ